MAIRVAVVGVGARGGEWVRELKASPAFELVACIDIDSKVLGVASQSLGIPPRQCFENFTKGLEESDCEAVVVANPVESHFQTCETALMRGLAVLVEKPFTVRLSEANRLVSLAESKGKPLIVAQNYRYLRAFRAARRVIQEGLLGKIGMVVCQYYRVPHEMQPSLALSSPSILWGMGVHHLDALRYVIGDEVNSVMADTFTLPWTKLPDGASMRALLSFAGGTHALYSATYESRGHEFFEGGQEFYARFVGERATLHVFQRWLILCKEGKLPRLIRRGPRKMTEERILLEQLERALRASEEPDCTGRDNLQTMAIVEACARSASERRWINPQELINELE